MSLTLDCIMHQSFIIKLNLSALNPISKAKEDSLHGDIYTINYEEFKKIHDSLLDNNYTGNKFALRVIDYEQFRKRFVTPEQGLQNSVNVQVTIANIGLAPKVYACGIFLSKKKEKKLFILMDLTGPSLMTYIESKKDSTFINNMNWQQFLKLALNLTAPLRVLESINKQHCDIKPENYVSKLNSNLDEVLLIDFDMVADNNGCKGGNNLYSSPELFIMHHKAEIYTDLKPYRNDVYSLGLLFYTILLDSEDLLDNRKIFVEFNTELFINLKQNQNDLKAFYQKIDRSTLSMLNDPRNLGRNSLLYNDAKKNLKTNEISHKNEINKQVINLLIDMTKANPNERITIEQVFQQLNILYKLAQQDSNQKQNNMRI